MTEKFDTFFKTVMEKAYHGSPFKITDKFSLKHVDKGQGAQTFGWGLYFAENKDVANSYRYAHASKSVNPTEMEGENYLSPSEAKEFVRKNGYVWAYDHYSEWGIIRSEEDVDYFVEYKLGASFAEKVKKRGHLYRVEIDVRDNELLDWDAPIDEQSPYVTNAIKDVVEYYRKHYWHDWKDGSGSVFDPSGIKTNAIVAFDKDQLEQVLNGYGSDLYRFLSAYSIPYSQKEASELLLKLGVKGIKYFDGGSRKNVKGTRNFVIFDDSLVRIIPDDSDDKENIEENLDVAGVYGSDSSYDTSDGRTPFFMGTISRRGRVGKKSKRKKKKSK